MSNSGTEIKNKRKKDPLASRVLPDEYFVALDDRPKKKPPFLESSPEPTTGQTADQNSDNSWQPAPDDENIALLKRLEQVFLPALGLVNEVKDMFNPSPNATGNVVFKYQDIKRKIDEMEKAVKKVLDDLRVDSLALMGKEGELTMDAEKWREWKDWKWSGL